MNTKTKRYLPKLVGLALALTVGNAYPCTNLLMTGYLPGGKIVVSARTMDFGMDLKSQLVLVPRNQSWTSSSMAGSPAPVSWKNTYGFVGINLLDLNTQYADGLNDAGLSAAYLWLDEAKFPGYPNQAGVALSIRVVVGYLLGQYKTAAEAKAALANVVVWGEYSPEIKMVPPVHLVVEDATGDSFVVEWIKGKQHIYDASNTKNYQAVLANSPPYPGQLQNFKSYAKQSCMDIRHNKGGLARLPGNSDSKPRFVRSALLSRCAQYDSYSQTYLLQGEPDAVSTAFQVIGRMETPYG